MNRITPSKLLILLAFMTGAFIMAACSPSAEKLINQGNEAFAKEEYLVALHEYQSAQVESPELAEPYYNAANALYREGAYTEALEQMQLALQNLDNETLAENSIYNLGNTFYKTQELDQAIESYINALLLDPDDQDAKYNLELALQQQQQQEQQQEQEQQDQENQDQEQDQSESSEHQDKEQQNEEDQSQNSGNQDQEQQEQEQENESEQGSEEQSPENEDPQKEEQQNQGQNNDSGQPQESQEQSDQQGQPGELPADQRMTEEQARQLLEALAQGMDTLQERLGQILRVQIPPPLQDW